MRETPSGRVLAAMLASAALLGSCQAYDATEAEAAESSGYDATEYAVSEAPEIATVGMLAPDFHLTDVNGNEHSLSSYLEAGKVVVLEWFNPDCPIAKDYHQDKSTGANDMVACAKDYADENVVWLAINSGAPGKQGAGKARNIQAVDEYGIEFPVLLDESGSVGMRYAAKTTPHMFVIDTDGVLRYDGAIDNGRPGAKGDVHFVRDALGAVLAGGDVGKTKTKPFGCSVKYAK